MCDRLDLVKARVAGLAILQHHPEGQGGITPGGLAPDQSNDLWYVKRHTDPEHAYSEHLMNRVYRHVLGNDAAPHSMILHSPSEGGRPIYLSKIIHGYQSLETHGRAKLTDLIHAGHAKINKEGTRIDFKDPAMESPWYGHEEAAKHFLKGTAADLLTGNDDLKADNVGMVKNRVVRVDNGANFYHEPTGGRRSTTGQHYVDMFNRWHVKDHASALSALHIGHDEGERMHILAHPDILRSQVNRIVAARDQAGGWKNFVAKHIPMAPDHLKRALAAGLEDRTVQLQVHVHTKRGLQQAS